MTVYCLILPQAAKQSQAGPGLMHNWRNVVGCMDAAQALTPSMHWPFKSEASERGPTTSFRAAAVGNDHPAAVSE